MQMSRAAIRSSTWLAPSAGADALAHAAMLPARTVDAQSRRRGVQRHRQFSPALLLLLLAHTVLAPDSMTAGGPPADDLTGPAEDMELVAVPLPVTADDLSFQSMALVAIVVTISAAGGIGGGGVLVPILMISEEIGPHGAIPMSKLTIFGSAACQLALNWRKRHKVRPTRALIDFDTTLMLEPPTLLGTVYGVLLNRMFPAWIIAILLLLFLVITTFKTSYKAFTLHAQESELSLAARARSHTPSAAQQLELSTEVSGGGVSDLASGDAREVGSLTALELAPPMPWKIIAQLVAVWVMVLAAAILRRTPYAECGSLLYWGVLFALTICIGVLSRATGRHYLRRHTAREARGYHYCEGDVIWDADNVVKLPVGCVLAGVMAGMLGVG
jgi:uncharacterized membrane protein YfcA